MEREFIRRIGCFVFFFLSSLCLYAQDHHSKSNEWVSVVSDTVIFNNNNHAAFTSITDWNDHSYVAFREARSHLVIPNDYGFIRILVHNKNKWISNHIFNVEGLDMRDPCLVKFKTSLLLYSSGYFSELSELGWSELQKINHNARHFIYLWKIREYNNELYGIGNYYKDWPLLLKSSDGKNWHVLHEFKIGGTATEADLLFCGKKMFICFRVESPDGSNSMWGQSVFPFDSFKWTQMDISLASPEMIRHSRNVFLLSGRETIVSADGEKERVMSLFAITKEGKVLGRYIVNNEYKDLGYPSICKSGKNEYRMSYYVGDVSKTKVRLMTFKVDNRHLSF